MKSSRDVSLVPNNKQVIISAKEIKVPQRNLAATESLPVNADASDEPTPNLDNPKKSKGLPTEAITSLRRQWASANIPLIVDQRGDSYAIIEHGGRRFPLLIQGKEFRNILRSFLAKAGEVPSSFTVREAIEHISSQAEMLGNTEEVSYRVAVTAEGIEIDIGDAKLGSIVVTRLGKIVFPQPTDNCLFRRTSFTRALPIPAMSGDVTRLYKYVNADEAGKLLIRAWMGFVLATPKASSVPYPILVLTGPAGSGKSTLAGEVITALTDPSSLGVQRFPDDINDLCLAANSCHVAAYDNLRHFPRKVSDALCTIATGGTLAKRKLYSDADMIQINAHGALILNGLHQFIEEPDLAQRCVPVELEELPKNGRVTKEDFRRDFAADAPFILRGLLEDIAVYLSEKQKSDPVKYPQRMLEFVKYLAVLEKIDNVPPGVYQKYYDEALTAIQLDGLLSNELAAAVLEFGQSLTGDWTGTPTSLLQALNESAPKGVQYSHDWPRSPSSLSRRLRPLVQSLETQGVEVKFSRGKERRIEIVNLELY